MTDDISLVEAAMSLASLSHDVTEHMQSTAAEPAAAEPSTSAEPAATEPAAAEPAAAEPDAQPVLGLRSGMGSHQIVTGKQQICCIF